MENVNINLEELSPPKIRSRRNSVQPIDRHINDINLDGNIYINAGIDSTCGIKRNSKSEILTDENIHSSNSTSTQNK